MPAQPLRLSCLHRTPCDIVATVTPSAKRWISTGLSEWVLTISDRRHGHAKQVRRRDPRNFNPMWAPALSEEARKAVNAAFDAMSTWRIETAKNSEKNSE